MSASEALKPCPFCGAPAEEQPWHGGGARKIMVSCSNEYCPLGPGVANNNPAKARIMWNRRAPSPVVAEVVKILRQRATANEKFGWTPSADQALMGELADRLERGE